MPLGPKLTAAQVLAAPDYSEDLEAAIGVADLVLKAVPDDGAAAELWSRLEFYNLQDVTVVPWTMPMVARLILSRYRLGEAFSTQHIEAQLPQRARAHAGPAVRALLRAKWAEPATLCPRCHNDIGPQFELSRRDGAKGWIVARYQLTAAGEALARKVRPVMSGGEIVVSGYVDAAGVVG